MVLTLRCDEETQGKPHIEIIETFVNLNCQVSSSGSHHRDGFLAGLTPGISNHSPNLCRYASVFSFAFTGIGRSAKGSRAMAVLFPFDLDPTECFAEVLRHELSPANRFRDLSEDDEDCNRTSGPLGNLKCAAANPADDACGVVPAD
ncbi:hypothetical protein HOY82DRAFT_595512 [Tuber indicum]|nr:hypothetical protein HOY82DRAFT_595512 [Tuber indicum]